MTHLEQALAHIVDARSELQDVNLNGRGSLGEKCVRESAKTIDECIIPLLEQAIYLQTSSENVA